MGRPERTAFTFTQAVIGSKRNHLIDAETGKREPEVSRRIVGLHADIGFKLQFLTPYSGTVTDTRSLLGMVEASQSANG